MIILFISSKELLGLKLGPSILFSLKNNNRHYAITYKDYTCNDFTYNNFALNDFTYDSTYDAFTFYDFTYNINNCDITFMIFIYYHE